MYWLHKSKGAITMITHQQSKSDEKKWYERIAQSASDRDWETDF